MRRIAFALLVTIGLVSPGMAEEPVHQPSEIIIGGGSGHATNAGSAANSAGGAGVPADPTRCVEVEIGSSRSMNCLNQKLKREVDRVSPTPNVAPIDARSPDTKTGVANVPGVAQQYGKNFGISAVPYRPAPPVYSSPLAPHR